MTDVVDAFITRWRATGGTERANYQLFLNELTDLLGVERPQPQSGRARSRLGISGPGLKLHGAGFILATDEAFAMGLGRSSGTGANHSALSQWAGPDRSAAWSFPDRFVRFVC